MSLVDSWARCSLNNQSRSFSPFFGPSMVVRKDYMWFLGNFILFLRRRVVSIVLMLQPRVVFSLPNGLLDALRVLSHGKSSCIFGSNLPNICCWFEDHSSYVISCRPHTSSSCMGESFIKVCRMLGCLFLLCSDGNYLEVMHIETWLGTIFGVGYSQGNVSHILGA